MQRSSGSLTGRRRERAFGRVLQQIRKEKGLSQEALGFDSGYHRTYISFLERGKKSPSLSTIMDMADALRVPASEMIRRVESLLKLKFEPS
jgi:transcriptional regulator with XRE-family HTH domain